MVSVAQALAAHAGRELQEGADSERAALLARQAYLFDRATGASRVAQVDAALREVVDRPHFGVTLWREGLAPGALAFSSDGRRLAVAERTGVRVWDREAPATPPLDLSHDVGDIRALLFAPEGDSLVALGARGLARWSVLRGEAKVLRPIADAFEAATLVTTPEGHVLAGILRGHGVEVIRVAADGVANTRRCCVSPRATLSALAISRSRPPVVATGDEDGTVRLWSSDGTGSLLHSLTGHDAPVASLAFDERGDRLAVGTKLALPDLVTLMLKGEDNVEASGGQVSVWDLTRRPPKGRVLRRLGTPVSAVGMSAERKLLAGAGADGSVRLWRSLDGDGPPEVIVGSGGALRAVAFSPDGRTLAATAFGIEGAVPAAVRLWRVVDLPGATTVLTGHDGPVRSLCFPPGENVLVSAGGGSARIWDLDARRTIAQLPHEEADVVAVACGADARTLATGTKPHVGSLGFEVRVWDRANPTTPAATLAGHASSVDAVVLSPDGRWLVSAGALEPEVFIRSRNDLSGAVTRLPTEHGQVRALAFSPDSRLLAWGDSEGWIGLRDPTRAFASAGGFADHEAPVRSVAFNRDGSLLASAGESGQIVLRSTRSGAVERLSAHRGEVYGLAFTADGVVVSAGSDGTVRLWDPKQEASDPRVLARYGRQLLSVAVSPDGAHIVAGGSNGDIFVWPTTDRLAEAICAMPWRNLACAEWSRFVGEGIQYVPTCPGLLPLSCPESR
jgi:WD40 repeat protein